MDMDMDMYLRDLGVGIGVGDGVGVALRSVQHQQQCPTVHSSTQGGVMKLFGFCCSAEKKARGLSHAVYD